jgi:hypothetical protein
LRSSLSRTVQNLRQGACSTAARTAAEQARHQPLQDAEVPAMQ